MVPSFYKWLAESTASIRINIDHFKKLMEKELEKVLDYYSERNYQLNNFKFNQAKIDPVLKNYPQYNVLMASIGKESFHDEIMKLYYWMKENNLVINQEYRNAWQHLLDYEETMRGVDDNYEPAIRREHEKVLQQTQANMEKIGQMIQNAVNGIEDWNGSPITIEARESWTSYNAIAYEPADSVQITVGNDASFTMFPMEDGKWQIDDIIEGGGYDEEEFFSTPGVKSDYFSLINELRNPGSASKGKILTLFTARPVSDRSFYQTTTFLPINVFLTNSASHADGLAHDLSAGEPRDVWKVRINSKYLTLTLDGPVKYYMVTKEKAPVEKISLY